MEKKINWHFSKSVTWPFEKPNSRHISVLFIKGCILFQNSVWLFYKSLSRFSVCFSYNLLLTFWHSTVLKKKKKENTNLKPPLNLWLFDNIIYQRICWGGREISFSGKDLNDLWFCSVSVLWQLHSHKTVLCYKYVVHSVSWETKMMFVFLSLNCFERNCLTTTMCSFT